MFVNRGYMRPIKSIGVNIQDYDVIAVGTPTWWYTMAPAVKTFLHNENWIGKEVIPFMTNGGWPGYVIKDMKKACAGASFSDEMQIQFDSTGESELVTPQKEIENWITNLNYPN